MRTIDYYFRDDLTYSSLLDPNLPQSTPLHAHSIILSDRNALNSAHNFFLHTMKNRLPDPSEICALEFKENFGDSKFARFQRLSASIGRFSTFFSCAFTIKKDRHGSQEPERYARHTLPARSSSHA
jgi:hypothetical protein